jgi:hypothetical protein
MGDQMPLAGKLSDGLRHVVAFCAGSLILTTLTVLAFAQPGPNIAGNYRGIITSCIVAAQPNLCRAALAELVQLAVDVDTKRANWEAAEVRGDVASAKTHHADYAMALEKLNNGVTNFNRDIDGPRKPR